MDQERAFPIEVGAGADEKAGAGISSNRSGVNSSANGQRKRAAVAADGCADRIGVTPFIAFRNRI